MKIKKINLPFLFLLIFLLSCSIDEESIEHNYTPVNHLKYFGFTLIDTNWDDPSDDEVHTNYADEVHTFSNIADILVYLPEGPIVERVQYLDSLGLQSLLHMYDVFFEVTEEVTPSGIHYALRGDFKERWEQFKDENRTILTPEKIGMFYIGEEPTWMGISYDELKQVSDLVKSDFPTIPILVIEASTGLADLKVPESVDLVGFDHYFIKNPGENREYLAELDILRSKLSSPHQKIMMVMDTHHIPGVHKKYFSIRKEEMGEVAYRYYELARNNPDIIGILGYFWPNGFDDPNSLGARGMSESIQQEYIKMGKSITGK